MSPMAPPRACATCGRLDCPVHRRTGPWHHAHPVTRTKGRKLQAVREQLLRTHPFCVRCGLEVATVRDHIVPLCEGGPDEETNVQALCATCHDAKTQAESRRHHA